MGLRHNLIHLAHAREDLRPHLLPILKDADQSADQLYQVRYREAKDLLRHIGQLLDSHRTDQDRDPTNWGYAGDMGYYVEKLTELRDALKVAGLRGPGRRQARGARPTSEVLDPESLQVLSRMYQSESAAERAIYLFLDQNGVEEAYRQPGPGRGDWQQWHLRTTDGDALRGPLNVFMRPGYRPGWVTLQVSL